ncbi:YbfB/YjiJ family MFS transporter [Lysinibacillus sp. 54212]|uniref:YbfB/YjiJ family MFS transporter n=1 Tax=Lysinibacillus sp. 54212 TaxID=3119829 RepID=UPI002FC5C33B
MKTIIGGILLLAVVMGFGRFAYTPLMPMMQEDLNLSSTAIGYLATSNFAGYFVGALLLSVITFKKSRGLVLTIALLINMLTTIGMGVMDQYWVLSLLRFFSGISSAVVFILTSSIVLNYIAMQGKVWWSGVLYGGVGAGIALSSVTIMGAEPLVSWRLMWILLGVLSILMGAIGSMLIRQASIVKTSTGKPVQKQQKPIMWLMLSYGLEGVGYIVTGTYIVLIANGIPTIEWDATVVWLIVGLAAIPSCVLWSKLAHRWEHEKTLGVALLIQGVGIIIPVLLVNGLGLSLSALLFGFTFMGITTLANAIARDYGPRILSVLTAMYAGGQMIGPPIAGKLMDYYDYEAALIFATCCIFLAGIIVFKNLSLNRSEA